MTEMVTITREEYDRLREAAEDLADLQAYDRAMADLASGVEELFPAEVVNRVIDGESPVKVFREYRGLSGADAARAAGIHRVQWHEIETGKKRGSVDTLKAMAAALRVDLDMIA